MDSACFYCGPFESPLHRSDLGLLQSIIKTYIDCIFLKYLLVPDLEIAYYITIRQLQKLSDCYIQICGPFSNQSMPSFFAL